VIGQAKNRLCKTGQDLARFYRHARPEDKDELDFLETEMFFYAQESTT